MELRPVSWEEAVEEIKFLFRKYAEGNTNYSIVFPNGSDMDYSHIEAFCNEFLPTNEEEAEERASEFLKICEMEIREDLVEREQW